MKTRVWPLLPLVVSLTSAPALAHPGHGQTEPQSWRHYLTEPLHVFLLVAGVVAVLAATWVAHRRERMTRTDRVKLDR